MKDTIGTLRARLAEVEAAFKDAVNTALVQSQRAEAAEAALREIQWGNVEIYSHDGSCGIRHECPECGRIEKTGHATDCCVGIALARVVVEGIEESNK